jgi:hypothetical protein
MFGVIDIPVTFLFSHFVVAGSVFFGALDDLLGAATLVFCLLFEFFVFASGTMSYAVAHLAMVLVLGNTEVVVWRQLVVFITAQAMESCGSRRSW